MSFVSIHTSTVHVSPVHVNPVHVSPVHINPMTTMLPVIVAASARNHHSTHSVPKQTTFCESRQEHVKCEPIVHDYHAIMILILCIMGLVLIGTVIWEDWLKR